MYFGEGGGGDKTRENQIQTTGFSLSFRSVFQPQGEGHRVALCRPRKAAGFLDTRRGRGHSLHKHSPLGKRSSPSAPSLWWLLVLRQTAEVAESEQDDRPRQAYGRVTWWVCGTPWRRFPHSLWSSSVLNSQCNNVPFLSSEITSGIQYFLLLIWMETLFVQTPSSVGFRVELY